MTMIATILRCKEHLAFSETGIFGQPLMVLVEGFSLLCFDFMILFFGLFSGKILTFSVDFFASCGKGWYMAELF